MARGKQRVDLGKGLGDLFAWIDEENTHDTAAPSDRLRDNSCLVKLPLDQTVSNSRQPRHVFDEDNLSELAVSVGGFGVLQPIAVRETAPKHFELIMGERRLRASKMAGKETISAIVRGIDDDALLHNALLGNLHRVNPNPPEGVLTYQQFLGDFNCTKEELSQRIHRSRPQVSNTPWLLNLPSTIQTKVAAGVFSVGHARVLSGLINQGPQELLAERVIAEGLSVHSIEEIVRLGNAPTEEEPTPRAYRLPSGHEAAVVALLSDCFDTRVKVAIGKGEGRITTKFVSTNDLDRIMTVTDGRTIKL